MALFRSYLGLTVIIALVSLLLLISCGKKEYTVKALTFPKGSKVHKNDWDYMAEVIVSSSHTPITDKSKKNVKIKIINNLKKVLFEKEYDFIGASIRAYATWDVHHTISMRIQEEGNKYAEDKYNKDLIQNGPKILVDLICHYNQEKSIFVLKQERFGESE
jgi:hypothetical protein